MSSSSTLHLTLPQLDVGSRKIRFIYLVDATSFRLTECPHKTPVIPLYLGADVFSCTGVRTENHPRYHAKFAKRGLATRIQFSSVFRFHGLKVPTANNSLWFYSVQGLFRVAFEMFSKQEQLAVLENFQDVWKSRINDCPLKTNYSLGQQLDVAAPGRVCVTRCEAPVPPLSQMGGEMMDACDTNDTSADHDYCSFPPCGSETQPGQVVSAVKLKLHDLDDKLSSGSDIHTEHLETVLLLLENIEGFIGGHMEEKDVTETVSALLRARDWGSVYSSSLLRCVGQWLGQQFHAANGSISEKVEGFKFQHIERISDLPPAEELASELFPEAMQTLLLHWMGLSEESTLEKRHSEYPILLLILEFANHNLITGVAHVLYSSLICK